MTSEGWINDHPKEYQTILDSLARRILMTSWDNISPYQTFQRKLIMDLADDIISIVLENNR